MQHYLRMLSELLQGLAKSATAGGGRGEREQRLEHAAFLSLWLARFVLPAPSNRGGPDDIVPGEEELHIPVRMAHGDSAALAPAVLASIYSGLSALYRHYGAVWLAAAVCHRHSALATLCGEQIGRRTRHNSSPRHSATCLLSVGSRRKDRRKRQNSSAIIWHMTTKVAVLKTACCAGRVARSKQLPPHRGGHGCGMASGGSEPNSLYIYWNRTDAASVSAPMHILQMWVWERFPELRPATTAATATASVLPDGEDVLLLPRAARWHDVHRAVDPGYARAVFWAPREFQWRPYGSSFWERRRDHGGARAPAAFARCLQACELVGVDDDIEQYNPHRVERQLGFDQDVPGTVTRLNTILWETAWETYDTAASEDYAFAVPSDEPGVTDEYAQWWKPYSVAFDLAVEERDAMIFDGLNENGETSALSNRDELDSSLMEETSNKGSGNDEGGSSSRNDTSGPKWAVGTMETVQRASVNRQVELAESRELVAKLVKEIQELAIDIDHPEK